MRVNRRDAGASSYDIPSAFQRPQPLPFVEIKAAAGGSRSRPAGCSEADRTLERMLIMAEVLLVDDDDIAREIVRRMIERDGHTVQEAGDGEAALAKLDGGLVPDCIVLDLMMPRVGGID